MNAKSDKDKDNAANALWGGRFEAGPAAIMEEINASLASASQKVITIIDGAIGAI